MQESTPIRLHVVVEGLVQGVGFRAFVQQNAVSLGLRGWVRNLWNGNVEVLAEGEPAAIQKLLEGLQRGPRASYVSNLQIEWQAATGEFTDFRVRMTG